MHVQIATHKNKYRKRETRKIKFNHFIIFTLNGMQADISRLFIHIIGTLSSNNNISLRFHTHTHTMWNRANKHKCSCFVVKKKVVQTYFLIRLPILLRLFRDQFRMMIKQSHFHTNTNSHNIVVIIWKTINITSHWHVSRNLISCLIVENERSFRAV